MARASTDRCRAIVAEAAAQGACCFSSDPSLQRQLERMTKRGELVCPHPGIYADMANWSELKPDQRALMVIRGLANKHPDWVFCDMSAALVHGLWVSYKDVLPIHVVVPTNKKSRKNALIVQHAASVEPVMIGGVQVTTLERTVFDCCRHHPVRACLGIADAALRFTGMDNTSLRTAFEQFGKRWKNWHRAAYVASIASPFSENGGESLARATMIMLGFQIPRLQVEVPDRIDGGTYRVDFLWDLPDGSQVAGELDGRDKYWLPEMTGGRDIVNVFADERLRESHVNALRIPVLRFSLADVQSPQRLSHLMSAFRIPQTIRTQSSSLTIDGWTVEIRVEYGMAA